MSFIVFGQTFSTIQNRKIKHQNVLSDLQVGSLTMQTQHIHFVIQNIVPLSIPWSRKFSCRIFSSGNFHVKWFYGLWQSKIIKRMKCLLYTNIRAFNFRSPPDPQKYFNNKNFPNYDILPQNQTQHINETLSLPIAVGR